MKPDHASSWEAFVDKAKKFFVVNVKEIIKNNYNKYNY
jgi:hypothetical protein